jgi:arabinose-5-phosphate isomerase
VRELMHAGEQVPRVTADTPMREAIYEMSAKKLGITAVTDAAGRLTGCISDGDLRRALERDEAVLAHTAGEHAQPKPRTIDGDQLAAAALKEMEDNRITSLFVIDDAGRLEGIVHLHDLWRLELF